MYQQETSNPPNTASFNRGLGAQCADASTYDVARQRVGETLARTEKLIEEIEAKFGSVLTPSIPTGGNLSPDKNPEPMVSATVQWFGKHNELQMRINNRLESLISRCEL